MTWEIAQVPEAQARQAFVESPFVRSVWPESVRRRTSESFVGPREYDDAVRQRKGVSRISLVHRVLTQTSLRVLPMAMLDSEPSHQEISSRATRGGQLSPQFAYHLGIRALAERRFAEAVQLLDVARSMGAPFPRVCLLHAFALGLAGRGADGLAVLRSNTRRHIEDPEGIESAWLEGFLTEGPGGRVADSRRETRVDGRSSSVPRR